MSATKVFNLRHLTKYILSFCGLEERITLGYVNKTTNSGYNKIVPNLQDVLALSCFVVGGHVKHDPITLDSKVKSSYLMFYLVTIEGSSLGIRPDYNSVSGTCIFDGDVASSICVLVSILGKDMYITKLDGRVPGTVRIVQCSTISILNNLPLLIKRKSLLLHCSNVE